jgi:NADPH:quinone reductase-like Zn-dependent oxidoreductase
MEKALKCHSLIVRKHSGPELLQIVEDKLRLPSLGEALIRVPAASVSRLEGVVRLGEALPPKLFVSVFVSVEENHFTNFWDWHEIHHPA